MCPGVSWIIMSVTSWVASLISVCYKSIKTIQMYLCLLITEKHIVLPVTQKTSWAMGRITFSLENLI